MSDAVYAHFYVYSTSSDQVRGGEGEGYTQFRLKQSWSQKYESRMLSWRHLGHWRELTGLPQPAQFREDASSVVLGWDSPTEGIVSSVADFRIFQIICHEDLKKWGIQSNPGILTK